MQFTARVTRDIVHSETAAFKLEAVDEADAERLALSMAEADDPKITWNDDQIDEVRDIEVLSVEGSDDDDEPLQPPREGEPAAEGESA